MSQNELSFRAPKGTRDILPPASWRWQEVTRLALDSFALAGYEPVETPMFEHTEVFERGVGATSEVVGKQMYTFIDRGDRSLTLRPEGTAPVVRAVLESSLDRGPLPVKLAYAGPMFRQERPQKGRYRQFFQVGIEAIGVPGPAVDAEVIELGFRFLTDAGVPPRLLLNSIGHVDATCRTGYLGVLGDFLRQHEERLAPEDRERINTNPLRTFDSKEATTKKVMSEAPLITAHLCAECRTHYDELKELLAALEVPFEESPHLVRGLDYYTRTAFEFVPADEGALGSQDALGGGGRYDGLAEVLGGASVPGIGFALGLDRLLLAGDPGELHSPITAYIVALGDAAQRAALPLVTRLRTAGIGADLDLAGRSMKGQMKGADRSRARYAVIFGDAEMSAGEVTLKDLTTGEQRAVAFDDLQRVLEGR
jgi:histidyl-tRNA synthetase